MSRGNNSNEGNGGWGKFFKVASAAAATAAVAGGLYAIMSSSPQQPPFGAPASPSGGPASPSGGPASPYGGPASPYGGHASPSGEPDDDEEDDNEAASSQTIWTKPEPGWVKLNVDGSRDHISYPPSSGCGGVMRDESEKWLLGFAQKLDPSCEVHETELEAILKGMELASNRKYKKLVVESDHKSAVSMVEKGVRQNHPQYTIISRIRQLLCDPKWEVEVVHVGRNANQVANRLAIDARGLSSEDLREYPYPPTEKIRTLLLKDSQGGAVGYY